MSKRPLDSASPALAAASSSSAAMIEDDGFTRVPTKEERRKQRKVEKRKPQFQYALSHFRNGRKIGIAHVRDLVLFIVADGQRPTWMVVDHIGAIQHTLVVLAPGLLPEHLGLAPLPIAAAMPFATRPPAGTVPTPPPARVPTAVKLFEYGVPTRAPGDARRLHSVVQTLLQSPLSDNQKKKREQAMRTAEQAHASASAASPLLYILSANQMTDNAYRLPSYVAASDKPFVPGGIPPALASQLQDTHTSEGGLNVTGADAGTTQTIAAGKGKGVVVVDEQGRRRRGNVRSEEGWVETAMATSPLADGRYPVLAIDCEMCLSEDGQELARVSVVNLDSDAVVFDELVTPPKPVTDYLTQFSGLTAAQLAHATHTLESVQAALVTGPDPIITPHTILLGHSLDCDLAVLKIKHPLVIDTSVIYRHARGPPYKPALKWLTQRWLGREIQGGSHGHDSEEDARACLDLLRQKLIHGPDFGDPAADTESIFERVERYRSHPDGPTKTTAIVDYGNPRGWYGSKAQTAIGCKDDDEVAAGIMANIASHDLVFGRLMELSNVQGWNRSEGGKAETTAGGDELEAAIARFNDRLQRLHESLPRHSALVLLTGHADPRQMLDLVSRRQAWERSLRETGDRPSNGEAVRWTTEDDRRLEDAVAEAREGMAFFCIKGKDAGEGV